MPMVNDLQHLKIPFDDIKVATENFKTLLGRGGYGWVYKGKLLVSGKETMVAVKRLDEQYGQGLKEFLTEIQLLSGQQHPNLISLVGFCEEGKEKSLVYQYAERGSLDKYIRRTRETNSTTLTWLQRLKICANAARGLDYLHRHVGGHRTIIHRDIKSSNILIDENWVAKIADLGLSKLSVTGHGISHIVTNGCGTRGYCDPVYNSTGVVTKKSDVYSFGVVLFEVLCGRLCLIDNDDGFTLSGISAKKYYKNNTLDKIIDQSLTEHIGSYSMIKFAAIAYRCLHDNRKRRPSMNVVVKELEEALKYQEEANDEYWDSLIKMLKIPREVYAYTKELFRQMTSEVYAYTKELFRQITSIGIVDLLWFLLFNGLLYLLVFIALFAVMQIIGLVIEVVIEVYDAIMYRDRHVNQDRLFVVCFICLEFYMFYTFLSEELRNSSSTVFIMSTKCGRLMLLLRYAAWCYFLKLFLKYSIVKTLMS